MIKNIVFDVGMVLVDFCWKRVFEQLGFEAEEFEAIADATVRSEYWNEYDRSRLNDEEILAGMIAKAPELEAKIRLFWEHVGDTIVCYPYSYDWVRELKEKGFRCYILSNYARRTYGLTRGQLPFEPLMDGCLFSFQVQQIKPEEEIYRTLFEKFSLKPEECVFLDDNPANVAAGKKAGMQAIQFTTREEAVKELRKIGVEA